jgi:hypothetical protein
MRRQNENAPLSSAVPSSMGACTSQLAQSSLGPGAKAMTWMKAHGLKKGGGGAAAAAQKNPPAQGGARDADKVFNLGISVPPLALPGTPPASSPSPTIPAWTASNERTAAGRPGPPLPGAGTTSPHATSLAAALAKVRLTRGRRARKAGGGCGRPSHADTAAAAAAAALDDLARAAAALQASATAAAADARATPGGAAHTPRPAGAADLETLLARVEAAASAALAARTVPPTPRELAAAAASAARRAVESYAAAATATARGRAERVAAGAASVAAVAAGALLPAPLFSLTGAVVGVASGLLSSRRQATA